MFEISEAYREQWDDPDVQRRIENNIETFRKSDAVIEVVDESGDPVADAAVDVEHVEHEFLFGCNLFYLDGFDDESANETYESRFTDLFNFATAPFYWGDLEPSRDQLRFEADSEWIDRRQPPDLVVEFAREHDLTLKGHPLIFHDAPFNPDWLPEDQEAVWDLTRERIQRIADRYGDRVPIWDVVNESLSREYRSYTTLPEGYVSDAFDLADRWFDDDVTLMINETTHSSHEYARENSPYYMQIERLVREGVRLDGIGFQYHVFSEDFFESILAGDEHGPEELLDVYSLYERFDVPLYVTEITIPTLGEDGPAVQAELAKNYYRLWFSVPNMAGITWWNLGDDTAFVDPDRDWNENKWGGGLLDADLDPKPAYEVLDELINEEWRTSTAGTTDASGVFAFRGFHGTYEVTVDADGTSEVFEVPVTSDGDHHHRLELGARDAA